MTDVEIVEEKPNAMKGIDAASILTPTMLERAKANSTRCDLCSTVFPSIEDMIYHKAKLCDQREKARAEKKFLWKGKKTTKRFHFLNGSI